MKLRLLLPLIIAAFIAHSVSAGLTAVDVQLIINQADARALQISPNCVIAVTDREGNVLAVWDVRGTEPSIPEIATAVSKAGTAAYLSSNQNAFTSRTAGFIIQQHFPPGVANTSTGPLVGVGLSNLFFSDINKFRGPASIITISATPGLTVDPVPNTSLDGGPGGVPLYKDGLLVGGVGITGDGVPASGPIPNFRDENPFTFIAGYDKDEDIALAGQRGFRPSSSITADNVYINGVALPYIESSTAAGAVLQGRAATKYPIRGAPPFPPYVITMFGGVPGEIRQPITNDPIPGTINGQPRLTAAEVQSIISFAADRARTTRAGIRLPIGTQMQVFITVVNNPNDPTTRPTVLGTFRTGEATLFSWDVAIQKARTALAFSNNNLAYSTRTVGFLGEKNYPPGIDADPPGPLYGFQEAFSGLPPPPQGQPRANPTPFPDPTLPNGVTIFPGGFPLYRNGQLIGAIGVSGDGE